MKINVDEKTSRYIADARDLAIIKCICDSARLSYAEIGKITRISKDRVRERLKVLEKELFILSSVPLIDYSKLGYKLFHVYLRVNKSFSRKDAFITNLQNHKRVIALTRLAGKWDIELQLLAKNRSELSDILVKLRIESLGIEILESEQMYLYSMRLDNFRLSKDLIKNEPKVKPKLDHLDLNILQILSKNARKKIIDIASACKVGEDVVRYRIKSMIKNKVILGFYTRTNKHRFGLTSYILELSLEKNPTNYDLNTLEKLPNVYYMCSFKGKRNIIINFSAKSNAELVNTLDQIKDFFGRDLVSFDLSLLLDRYKFVPFSIQ